MRMINKIMLKRMFNAHSKIKCLEKELRNLGDVRYYCDVCINEKELIFLRTRVKNLEEERRELLTGKIQIMQKIGIAPLTKSIPVENESL